MENLIKLFYLCRKSASLTHNQVLQIYSCRTFGRQAKLCSKFAEIYAVNQKEIRDIWNSPTWFDAIKNYDINVSLPHGQCPGGSIPANEIPILPAANSGSEKSLPQEAVACAIGTRWQIPVFSHAPPRRFCEFDYNARPIRGMFSSVQPAVTAAMARFARAIRPRNGALPDTSGFPGSSAACGAGNVAQRQHAIPTSAAAPPIE